jgi:mannose-6-phosphate isomerase-like protein (cupin superfamily)
MTLEHCLTRIVRPLVGRLEHEENLMNDFNGPSEPFHGRSSETEVLDLFGVHIRILMPASATDGALSIFDDHNDPGAGPPLHVHYDADEIFFVVAGSYRFICSEKVIEAGAGDIVLVPRGAPHTFLNCGTGPGHLLVTLRPGGFEGFFRAVVDAKLDVARDMPAIVEIARRYHLEFLGPNPLAAIGST